VTESIFSYPFQIRNQQLVLTNERCIYWKDQKLILLSDTHFGKSGHFRKEGIGVPQRVMENDLTRLQHITSFFQPKGLLIIGDLFHSKYNQEIKLFEAFRRNNSFIDIHLISGNHDILHEEQYKHLDIHHHGIRLNLGPFTFVHDIHDSSKDEETYYFCGHLHPGISIQGKAKQKLKFPCFYFTENHACLPAFSLFTGMGMIKPRKKDQAFMITKESIIPYRPQQDQNSVVSNHQVL
jgi:DNA ligase-associated metallophosphoesterase